MKSLSIALKLWLPAIAVSVGLVAMASGSAVRTIRSQAITVAEQSEQQSKLEMAAPLARLGRGQCPAWHWCSAEC